MTCKSVARKESESDIQTHGSFFKNAQFSCLFDPVEQTDAIVFHVMCALQKKLPLWIS